VNVDEKPVAFGRQADVGFLDRLLFGAKASVA
jgi:hypothetical protein